MPKPKGSSRKPKAPKTYEFFGQRMTADGRLLPDSKPENANVRPQIKVEDVRIDIDRKKEPKAEVIDKEDEFDSYDLSEQMLKYMFEPLPKDKETVPEFMKMLTLVKLFLRGKEPVFTADFAAHSNIKTEQEYNALVQKFKILRTRFREGLWTKKRDFRYLPERKENLQRFEIYKSVELIKARLKSHRVDLDNISEEELFLRWLNYCAQYWKVGKGYIKTYSRPESYRDYALVEVSNDVKNLLEEILEYHESNKKGR